MIGFLQYLAPTLSLGIAVFVYGEAPAHAHGPHPR
jgi:EamA domain-containing membrane protein RarD